MTFSLFTVADLDSKQQTLTVTGSLTISWSDARVSWNASENSEITFVELEEGDIWRPRIVLDNSVDNMDPVQSKNPVILFYTGQYRWEGKAIFRVRCRIDISLYPFDAQFCQLMFAPATGYMLNITVQDTFIRQSVPYDGNAEFILQNITQGIFHLDDGMYAVVGITLKREPTFYIITIIIPILLMSLLNPFVFLIPARSGEKLGFIMAVFVSHTMFLTLMRESVPPSVSNLTRFLIAIEVQTFLTILASIFVIAIHHRMETAEELRRRKVSMSKDVDDPLEMERPRRCCRYVSLERCLDGLSFVISMSLSCSACILLTQGVDMGDTFRYSDLQS
ncbi:neuronal acetylcholine receptor subunit non-alpha-3-like [Haliotis asinina]|uniref:neuronal acetylcholine receptor subunit non-alpha-3-like n=1 Tax=Haliotis asinina TaxID=109174 RepID=UPI003531EBE7